MLGDEAAVAFASLGLEEAHTHALLQGWSLGMGGCCNRSLCPSSRMLLYRVQNAAVEVRVWGCGGSPDGSVASVLTLFSIYSKVFSFVQTLTGCEDQAKLFKDEVRRAGGWVQVAKDSCLPTGWGGIGQWPSSSGLLLKAESLPSAWLRSHPAARGQLPACTGGEILTPKSCAALSSQYG